MTDEQTAPPRLNEISLQFVMIRLLKGWRTPAVFILISILIAFAGLMTSHPTYTVRMTVVPAPSSQEEMGTSGGSALSSILGLAGAPQTSSSYLRYQKLLTSTVVADRMQKTNDMLHVVFSSIWDKKRQTWVRPLSLRDMLLGWLFRMAHISPWSPPDITTLADYLQSKIIIVSSPQNDIVSISMNHQDPAFATRLLLMAHQQANAVLSNQVAARASQQVAYLQRKLAQTTVEDYRQTLLALLSAQEKTLMLTQTSAPYAAEIMIPPIASAHPTSPRPILNVAVAILVGGLLGAFVVIFFGPDWWQKVLNLLQLARTRPRRSRQTPLHHHD